MQASWWKGLVPDHSCVELGLVHLVGRAMSGNVIIGQLCAQKDFKQPCVPSLAVWPEASHHWSL